MTKFLQMWREETEELVLVWRKEKRLKQPSPALKRRAQSQGMQAGSKSWKEKEGGFSFRVSRKDPPSQHSDLIPVRSMLESYL